MTTGFVVGGQSFSSQRPPIKVATVLKVVAHYNGMSVKQLLTRSREQKFVRPRQIAAYLCTQLTSASLPCIGYCFGGFDHSTILYARDKIKQLLETDQKLRAEVTWLTGLVKAERP